MPTLENARTWYTSSDPVHGFEHVYRVYRTAEYIATAEGADIEIVHAAALLHDAEGSAPGQTARANHHEASADFARIVLTAENWLEVKIEAVQHCIRAHRYRSTEAPQTLEAKVLFDADKLDVLGAIGVARTVAYAALAGQPIYTDPSEQFRLTGKKLPEEPHSSYHEYLFKLRNVKDRMCTPAGRKLAKARHSFLVEYYEQLVAEMKNEK